VLGPATGTAGAYVLVDDANVSTTNAFEIPVTATPILPPGTFTGVLTVFDASHSVVQSINLGTLTAGVPIHTTLSVGMVDASNFTVQGIATSNGVDGPPVTVAFVVDAVPPTLVVTAPSTGTHLGSANDADPALAGTQIAVSVTTTGLADGASVTLADGTLGTAGVVVVHAGLAAANLGFSDGVHTLTAHANDAAGNPGASAAVTFSLDSNAPVVASVVVAKANGQGVINVAGNGNVETSGTVTSDVLVTFSSSNAIDDGARVTLQGAGGATQTVTASGNQARFTAFPFAQGTTNLVVVASDLAGNASTGGNTTIVVDTVRPVIAITSPTGTLNIASDLNPAVAGLQTNVVVTTDAEDGQPVTFLDVAASLGSVATSAGGATLSNLTLADGTHTLTATVSDIAGNTATSSPDVLTVDTNAPVVASVVVAKANGQGVINVAGNGNVETSGTVTSDVLVTFASSNAIDDGARVTLQGTGGATQTVTASGNQARFTAFPFSQGTTNLVVVASDLAGNASTGGNTTIVVDTVRPVITVVAPNGTLLVRDDKAPGTPGMQTDIVVNTDADAGQLVAFSDTGASLGNAAVAAGAALLSNATLGEGTRTLTATVSDASGNTSTSAPVVVLVDSIAPTLVITVPANNTSIGSANDLDNDPSNGVQTTVSVLTTGLIAGRTITVTTDAGNQTIGTAAASASGTTVVPVTFILSGTQHITASASDENGNPGVSDPVTLDVLTNLFLVAFTNPPVRAGTLSISSAEDFDAATAGAQVHVTVSTDASNGATATLLVNGLVATTSTVTAGAAILDHTFVDGTDTIEVQVSDGVTRGTTGPQTVNVKTTQPTVTITNPAAATVTFNQASDASAVTPGLQTTVSVSVTNCENGNLQIFDGSTVIGSASINATGSAAVNVAVTDLVEGTNLTWTATCTDVEGNTPASPATRTVTIDLTAPTAAGLTAVVVGARGGIVDLQFVEPGDDANVGSATTLQIAVSRTTPIVAGNFGASGQQLLSVTPSSGGTPRTVRLPTLTFNATFFVALRAVDDVGNSSFSVVSFDLKDPAIVLGPPSGVTGWGQALSRAALDIDGDGFVDIAVGAPDQTFPLPTTPRPGGVEIIFGASSAAGIRRQFVRPPATIACAAGTCVPEELGYAANIVPSLNGDAFPDVIVVGYDRQRFDQEYLFIYAGGPTGIATTPSAILEGDVFSRTGYSVTVADVNGDGLPDWIASSDIKHRDFVFLNTGSFPTSGLISARASAVITGAAGGFGRATANLGDIDGDGADDLAILDNTGGATAKITLVRGRTLWPFVLNVDTDVAATDKKTFAIKGADDLVSADVDLDGHLDLGVVTTSGLQIILLSGGALTQTPVAFAGVSASNFGYGTAVLTQDINGDGQPDLLTGGQTKATVFFNSNPVATQSAAATFDVSATLPNTIAVLGAKFLGANASTCMITLESRSSGTLTIHQ
jgi:hypothetical protein